jgi:hypothetical protein
VAILKEASQHSNWKIFVNKFLTRLENIPEYAPGTQRGSIEGKEKIGVKVSC